MVRQSIWVFGPHILNLYSLLSKQDFYEIIHDKQYSKFCTEA